MSIDNLQQVLDSFNEDNDNPSLKIWISNEKGPICAVAAAETVEKAVKLVNKELAKRNKHPRLIDASELVEFVPEKPKAVVMADIGDY